MIGPEAGAGKGLVCTDTTAPQFSYIHSLRLWERKKAMLKAAPQMNLLEGSKLEERLSPGLPHNFIFRRKLGGEMENHCVSKKDKGRGGWYLESQQLRRA